MRREDDLVDGEVLAVDGDLLDFPIGLAAAGADAAKDFDVDTAGAEQSSQRLFELLDDLEIILQLEKPRTDEAIPQSLRVLVLVGVANFLRLAKSIAGLDVEPMGPLRSISARSWMRFCSARSSTAFKKSWEKSSADASQLRFAGSGMPFWDRWLRRSCGETLRTKR